MIASMREALLNVSTIFLVSTPVSDIEHLNEVPENIDTLIVVGLIFFAFLLSTRNNEAVRKQWRTEDNFYTTELSFLWRLILFPRFLFYKEGFKNRTIKFKKASLVSFVIAFSICLMSINLIFRAIIPLIYFFWSLFLIIKFKQEHRGF